MLKETVVNHLIRLFVDLLPLTYFYTIIFVHGFDEENTEKGVFVSGCFNAVVNSGEIHCKRPSSYSLA